MKQNKFYLMVAVLGLILTTLAVSTVSSAYQGDPSVKGPNYSEEERVAFEANREALQTAIESRDYSAWKEIVDSRPKITDYVTADNFDKFAQMHELMIAGKFEEAQAIREELGLPAGLRGGMMGHGRGAMMGRGMGIQNQVTSD